MRTWYFVRHVGQVGKRFVSSWSSRNIKGRPRYGRDSSFPLTISSISTLDLKSQHAIQHYRFHFSSHRHRFRYVISRFPHSSLSDTVVLVTTLASLGLMFCCAPTRRQMYDLCPVTRREDGGKQMSDILEYFPVGGGPSRTGVLTASSVMPYRIAYGDIPVGSMLKYLSTTTAYTRNEGDMYVGCVIPPSVCVSELTVKQLPSVASAHGIKLPRASRRDAIEKALISHTCNLVCNDVVTDFKIINRTGVPIRASTAPFPPKPLSKKEKMNIVSDWCDVMSPERVNERPCAVCARLSPESELKCVHEAEFDLSVLCRPGAFVTRKERFDSSDPVDEHFGPILHNAAVKIVDGEKVLDICKSCRDSLNRGGMSRHALANGMWIGDVPEHLRNLNFVEKLIVARYRHNVCVVRVDKGQRKMCANAVVFPQPIAKFYDILPPPRDEIDMCLAVLFTGSVAPTGEDYKRTPLLVSHRKVLDALYWLRINHKDYEDIIISEENMSTYPEDSPPVTVLHRPNEGDLGGEMMAVHELDNERGVENGMCPFAVHGLAGSELADMSYEAKVATALDFFTSGGSAVAYGHVSEPASMYHNPNMFPGMFPWLFPYGLGGIGNSLIKVQLERPRQVKQLLMYGDRRFQTDEYFCFIAFNQQQIMDSTRGGYILSERKTASSVADKIVNINQTALKRIIERGSKGEYLKPEDAEERSVFELLGIIDYVSKRVQGSSSTRKLLRNEIFSLIIAKGVPIWFITFVPTDFKSPLCLYYCGVKIDLLDPLKDWPEYPSRMRAIADNPVACARYFDKIVRAFLERVLKFGSDDRGLFGKTETYYGTVESQGRLTLHLHLLLWISGSLSPQEIQDKIVNDPEFRDELVAYLEDCHQGGYSVSDAEKIAELIATEKYGNTTEQLAKHPAQSDHDNVDEWWNEMCIVTDCVVHASNRHNSGHTKGCIRGGSRPYCKARFPRELVEMTKADVSNGEVTMKHTDKWLNTYNVVLSFLLRGNSDVTCLLSGTQIRAVVVYVTDYITKGSLSTNVIFQTVKSVLDKNTEAVNGPEDEADRARKVITKIVNALTALHESPGPMICGYLLGQPDHYTPEKFKVFYWHSYVREVIKTSHPDVPLPSECDGQDDKVMISIDKKGVKVYDDVAHYVHRPVEYESWTLYDYLVATAVKALPKQRTKIVISHENDASDDDDKDDTTYSDDGEDVDLENSRELESASSASTACLRFLHGHPLVDTHGVFRVKDRRGHILNFAGGRLPRVDKDDFQYYCCVMLTLFFPGGWRSGFDIRSDLTPWSMIYERTAFDPYHQRIIKNMNALNECVNAKYEFSKRRQGLDGVFASQADRVGEPNIDGIGEESDELLGQITDNDDIFADEPVIGKSTAQKQSQMEEMTRKMCQLMGTFTDEQERALKNGSLPSTPSKPPAFWKDLLARCRASTLESRRVRNPDKAADRATVEARTNCCGESYWGPGIVRVVTQECIRHFADFRLYVDGSMQDTNISLLHDVITQFSLNEDQERAFVLAATYMHHRDHENLRMYLGGMAGTGKSRVVNSLITFLDRRNEGHRYVVTAPTGSAAALLAGSTYHYVLGFSKNAGKPSKMQLQKTRGRLTGVDLIFIDEVSMVSCRQLCEISTRLSKSMNTPGKSFGGLGVILAGDFAQLPPSGSGSYPLYSHSVGLLSKGTSPANQENAIGKSLWHSFTTVVILTQNMRQTGITVEDSQFRDALIHMRNKSCTKSDIALLNSRIIGRSGGSLSLSDPQFKNVSVITARNAHRDAINMYSVRRFAIEHSCRLEYFFSVDEWESPNSKSAGDHTRLLARLIANPRQNRGDLDTNIRELLWGLSPSATNNHAGTLALCVGMPVLLKSNEATELCATNGAEATIHSWDFFLDHLGRKILNTLFVKLENPPRHVSIPGLPEDVIPLTRARESIPCTLPDDSIMWISREQVHVLPNFAMTDFASQGRTRPFNPCHLKFCRSHQSIYTCLSRSSSLKGTLIIDEFDARKLVGGLTGALRAEFKDLDILNEITKLKYSKRLSRNVSGTHRAPLIKSYLAAQNSLNVANTGASDQTFRYQATGTTSAAADERPHDLASRGDGTDKRKYDDDETLHPNKRAKTSGDFLDIVDATPPVNKVHIPYVGDSEGRGGIFVESGLHPGIECTSYQQPLPYYRLPAGVSTASCAYDVLVASLLAISHDRGSRWLSSITHMNPYAEKLSAMFTQTNKVDSNLANVRDALRKMLTAAFPQMFSLDGSKLSSVGDLLSTVFKNYGDATYGSAFLFCPVCGTRPDSLDHRIYDPVWDTASVISRFYGYSEIDSQAVLDALFNMRSVYHCPNGCGAYLLFVHRFDREPAVLVVNHRYSLAGNVRIRAKQYVRVRVNAIAKEYVLAAAFRVRDEHFDVHGIRTSGKTWLYDGQVDDGRFREIAANYADDSDLNNMSEDICSMVYVPVPL